MSIFNNIAVAAPEILLPEKGTDLTKWAVIACDQYTSQPDYWEKVEENVGDAPSALRMILPEVYLSSDTSERLANIASTASSYLENGLFESEGNGFVVLDRKTSLHPSRKGLVIAVDLEQYSYEPGNKERIRATEGTVISRIPPRVKIRANSPLELPHIMLLIDDPEDSVIGKAWSSVTSSGESPCYDFDLMMGSGHIRGYRIREGSKTFNSVIDALEKLVQRSADGMLFAVGDGNHSLASAKAYWDSIKDKLSESERETHPARYALAEVVNIHDSGLDFEPIFRVVFGVSREKFVEGAGEFFKDCEFSTDGNAEGQSFTVIDDTGSSTITLGKAPHTLAVGSVQKYIDELVSKGSAEVDYIHGEDAVRELAMNGSCGIIVPGISKDTFFRTIEKDGVFPRKTFSMGEAFEKRFYLEAKKIQ